MNIFLTKNFRLNRLARKDQEKAHYLVGEGFFK